MSGDATRVLELCAVARQSVQAGDRDLALNLLLGAALRCWWADTGPAARARVAEVTRELTGAIRDPRYIAALAVAEPVLECAAVMDLLSRFVPDDLTDGEALRLLGMAARAVGDTVRSVDFLARSEALLREQGRLGLLSQVLSMQVIDRLELGDWDRASAAAAEGDLADPHAGLRRAGQGLPRPHRPGLHLCRRGGDGSQPATSERPAVLRPARPGAACPTRASTRPPTRSSGSCSSRPARASTSGSDSVA